MDWLDEIYKLARNFQNAGVGGFNHDALYSGAHKMTGGTGGQEGAYKRATAFLSGVPLVGDVVRQIENDRYYADYLRNNGMTWADVKYPSRLGYGTMGSTLSFVSRNISDLYGDKDKKRRHRGSHDIARGSAHGQGLAHPQSQVQEGLRLSQGSALETPYSLKGVKGSPISVTKGDPPRSSSVGM